MQIDVPQPSKAVIARNRKRARERKCLQCDSCAKRRGLCIAHYMKFVRARQKHSGVERLQFDLQCVADGFILDVQEVRRHG